MVGYYEILELNPKASPEVIRAVYQLLLQHYSLDNNSDEPEKTRKLNAIKQAYDVLSDPEKRKAYDSELAKVRGEPNEFFAKHEAGAFTPGKTVSNRQYVSDKIKSIANAKDDGSNDGSILSRLKWKRWGWAVSILVVVIILISMVRPDPEKALQGQMAVKLEAERDRKELEAALKKTELEKHPANLADTKAKGETDAKTGSAQSAAGNAAP